MSEQKRREKRWNREHSRRAQVRRPAPPARSQHAHPPDGVQLVYRPKNDLEAARRFGRMQELCGTPFVTLPGINDHKAVAATIADGTPYGRNITFEHLEQVYNDSLLMDAISNWGEDGPLYEQTLDAGELQVFRLARDLFAGVPIPAALQRPPQ